VEMQTRKQELKVREGGVRDATRGLGLIRQH
jgi:hypothetical protein